MKETMMHIIKSKKFALLCTFLLLFVGAVWMGKLASSHRIAFHAVMAADGYWSATPGWPFGAHFVGFDTVLDESDLVRAIEAQRHNRSLNFLSVPGQDLTPRVANSIASIKSLQRINIINCRISPAEAGTIIRMEALQEIIVDPVSGSVISEAAGKHSRKDIHILIRQSP